MLILNSEKQNLFKCGSVVHKYLSGKVVLFNIDNDWYYYKNTKELKDALDNAPFWVKVVASCVKQ